MKFGKFDVTEAQLITMLLMLVSGSFGTGFWGWKLLGFLPLRWIPLIFATVTAFLTLPSTFNNILFGGAGRNQSTVAVRTSDLHLIFKIC